MIERIVGTSLLVVCLVSGCSSRLPGYPPPASSATAESPVPAASATRGGELDALTARGVVVALSGAGFAAPNLVDTTAQECPRDGCEQSVVTDTVRVKSFASTARAQSYAATRGLFQVQTVVVEFTPALSAQERDRYQSEIAVLVR